MKKMKKNIFSLSLAMTQIFVIGAVSLGMAQALLVDTYTTTITAGVSGVETTTLPSFDGKDFNPGEIRNYKLEVKNSERSPFVLKNTVLLLNDNGDNSLVGEDNSFFKVYPGSTPDKDILDGVASEMNHEFIETILIDGEFYEGRMFELEEQTLNGAGFGTEAVTGGKETVNFEYKVYFDSDAPLYTAGREPKIANKVQGIQYYNTSDADWEEIVSFDKEGVTDGD